MLLLGYDIGTSSVKAALVDAQTGQTVASAQYPDAEAPIMAKQPGWAEQDPEMWWEELKQATARAAAKAGGSLADVKAIGISYQMHGLVCVGKDGKPLRPSIIWCDGRAVPYGNKAFEAIGGEKCLQHLLNSPGNFTAAKLAWVKENEPELFAKIDKIMLPGDYIAMKLSGGDKKTTVSGLSEGMFWDFKNNEVSKDVMNYYGFSNDLIAEIVPTFSVQSTVCQAIADELGIPAGTPISYRGGCCDWRYIGCGVWRVGRGELRQALSCEHFRTCQSWRGWGNPSGCAALHQWHRYLQCMDASHSGT